MTDFPVQRFADREALAEELARTLTADLDTALGERGAASLVVSGGSTPRLLFAALARRELAWDRVTVTLADERWVDPGDEASNEGLVRRTLLTGAASAARFVAFKSGAPTPEEGRDATEAALAAMPRPFDAVVLGMGDDGHTASLFPGAAELRSGLDAHNPHLCLAVHPPAAPHPRLSLTLRALLDSRRIIVHVTGAAKWEVYEQALSAGPVEEMPIRAVLRSGHPGLQIFWAP